ncbi:MAG: carboxypeptidase-like regulatory domain-containing protein [Chitinophagia bacterium]|nr:carboxypeptidase-like regulatory domain-containing protein [Chitinophagia bacterium]
MRWYFLRVGIVYFIVQLFSLQGNCTLIRGKVADKDGHALPFASILVIGKGKGVTANGEGFYEIELQPGVYRLSCQYVGYATQEKQIQVEGYAVTLDFFLEKQELVLPTITVSNKENPANRLIREMIRRQEQNQTNSESFNCEVYSKGQLRLRDFPSRFLSQKVDFEDGDSSKKKILYLSETISRFSQQNQKEKKIVVVSSKVSGNTDGFGLAVPDQYSLYKNLVLTGTQLNPRGFVSPLASNAFSFYRYKLLGTFSENEKLISRIKVIPKRKGEPLFEGEISIVQEDWQLHSVELLLNKSQQLELVDTLRFVQLYQEVDRGRWMLASQVLYPALNKIRNKFTLPKLILTGQTILTKGNKFSLTLNPLLEQVAFTPAEGMVLQPVLRFQSKLDSGTSRRSISGALTIRTGLLNGHINPYFSTNYSPATQLRSNFFFGIGRQVLQFNPQSPITDRGNTLSCLLFEQNRIKSYEAFVFRLGYNTALGAGLSLGLNFRFENRKALNNSTSYTWVNKTDRAYTPNYPVELSSSNILNHQLADVSFSLRWQPGTRYIKLPERIVNVGSDKPVFSFTYSKALKNVFKSDGKYSKWKIGVTDSYNFGLKGLLRIRLATGGFLNRDSVPLPDYIHFNGNNSQLASEYLNSFQVLPVYQLSHTEKWYGLGHLEYNLRGLLTNKIPIVKKLKPYLIVGVNACYVSKEKNHVEWFVGVDNLLKQFRIDYVTGYQPGGVVISGIRIGFKGM